MFIEFMLSYKLYLLLPRSRKYLLKPLNPLSLQHFFYAFIFQFPRKKYVKPLTNHTSHQKHIQHSNVVLKHSSQQLLNKHSISISIIQISNLCMSLYERLGSEAAISAVVDHFYTLMLADDRVSHFYKAVDLAKLRCRQKQFITMVTGGPHNYQGTDMKSAHCKLNISQADFDVTWENLQLSLKHFQVENVLIDELKAIFYSVQGDIVKEKTAENLQFKVKDKNIVQQVSKCPFSSGKGTVSKAQGQENCPFKLKNNPYMKHYY